MADLPNPFAGASAASTQSYKPPEIHNLGDLLDWQRGALQEAIFRKGTSDANREELRRRLAALPDAAALGSSALTPAGPFLIYGAKHYHELPAPMRGIYDAVLDTASDPLTLETADTGAVAKGIGKAAMPLIHLANKVVPLDAAAQLITKGFNYGGAAILKHGRTAANTAIGMLNRSDAESKEIFRRLQEIDARTMAGLTPKQTSAVQKILHGQLPSDVVQRVYAAEPAVQKAVDGRRELTDAIVRMQEAPFGGVQEALLKRPGAADKLPPLPVELQPFSGRPNIFRVQSTAGEPEISRSRNATYYGMDAQTAREKAAVVGSAGEHLLSRVASAKKPLELPEESANLTLAAVARKLGANLGVTAHTTAAELAQRLPRILDSLGVKPAEVSELMKDPTAAEERAAIELARKYGHDAIRTQDEYIALHPSAAQAVVQRPGEFTSAQVRHNYFPARGQAQAVAADQPAKTYNLLDTFNPHTLEQSEFHIPSKQVQHFEDAFQGMLKTSARNISANRVKQELAGIYGSVPAVPEAIREIFEKHVPATGTERSAEQQVGDFVKGVVGLPKIGIVGTTPIHMFNILSLLLIHAPDKIPEAVKNFGTILRAGGDPAKRFAAMLPAIEKGIDVATHEKAPVSLLSKPPFNLMNRWTWDWDVAAKQALANKYIAAGHSPLDAGVRASNDLVNYKNTSPVTAALRWAMPFATFAEGGAKAVFAAVAKQPALVEFENRLLGGRLLGGGNHSTDTMLYQPPANVGRGPFSYLRSKTSDLIKLPAALAVGAIPARGAKSVENWLLSGRTPLGTAGDIVTGPVPYLRDALNLFPVHGGKTVRGYTPDSLPNEALFSSTGVSLPPKPKVAPHPLPVKPGALPNPFGTSP